MKKTLLFLAVFAITCAVGRAADVVINATNFPDATFRQILAEYDTDENGKLSMQEMEDFPNPLNIEGVTNLKGIELLTPLKGVSIFYSSTEDPSITSFNYALPNLESIEFNAAGSLTAIDLTRCTKLTNCFVGYGAPKLSSLKMPASITNFSLDGGPGITSFDPSQFPNLSGFVLYAGSGITDLDFSNHPTIESVSIQGSDSKNQLNTLVMSNCPLLANIHIENVAIKALTLKSLPEVRSLLVDESDVVKMLVESLPELTSIEARDNDLATLTLKKLPIIGGLQCQGNRLQSLIIDECPNFGLIEAQDNRLMWLDLSCVKKGDIDENTLHIDDQQPRVQAVKLSPTETGLRVHPRFDVSRVLKLRAKGIAQTPRETTVDGIRYFVFYDNGPDTPNLVGSDCYYEYQTKWPFPWVEENTKDNNLPVTLNVNSWTKHQASLTLSKNSVTGKYGEPAPAAPSVTRSQDYDGKITYSSSNENVVKVNPNTGVLTVVGAGTATIHVVGAETDYRLAPKTSYTVVIEKATPVIAFPASEVSATYGGSAPQNLLNVTWYEGTVTYASANEKRATVSAKGAVTIKGAGDVTIKGIAPETSNFRRAEVSYVLHIDKASPVFAFEKSALEAVLGKEVPENKLSVGLYDGTVAYTSSNEAVATVATDGTLTPLADGKTVIRATGAATANCYAAQAAEYTLTVKDLSVAVGAPTDEPRQDAAFDLSGRPVNPQTAQRGLYILRGKKVVKAKE